MNDNEQINQIKTLIKEWLQKHGHDKCWYYPDIFCRIAEIVGVEITEEQLSLPPEDEFEENCHIYRKKLYHPPI